MFPIARAFTLAFGLFSFAPAAFAFQETPTEEAGEASGEEEGEGQDPFEGLKLVTGPAVGDLGESALVNVPEGLVYLDGKDTRTLMERFQNPVSNTEVGLVGTPDLTWFVVFEFDEMGYVSDEDKDDLDADELLESMREANEAASEERKKRGWETLTLEGWEVPPHYDTQSNNLEWALRLRSESGGVSINHNSRALGRHGVMVITLVCGEGMLTELLPQFREFLKGFEYKSGHRYSEFTSGDKLAEYGLTALVAGGAGALAVKTGLLGKLWKPIAAGLVAIAAFFKKIFGGKKKETAPTRSAGKPETAENSAGDEPPAAK